MARVFSLQGPGPAGTLYAYIDDEGNVNAEGELRIDGVAVASIDSSGNVAVEDSNSFIAGTGNDFTISHNGTNTTMTSATGDLIIDNTLATGSTIARLGTDTSATSFEVQTDSANIVLSVTPSSSTAATVLAAGVLDLNGTLDQDAALTGTGTASDITVTFAHASQSGIGQHVSMSQIANGRTSGTITAHKATVVSLTGTTAGVDHYAYEAAVTAGDADSDHFAFKVGAGFQAIIDASSCATGEADVLMADNLAIGFQFREAANTYLTLVTTNDAERITFGKLTDDTVTTVDMANAAHALVFGTAGAAQTKITGNIVYADANGGSQNLTLPAAAGWRGPWFIINTGGEPIVVKDSAAATVITIDASTQHGVVFSNGTTVFGFMGGIT